MSIEAMKLALEALDTCDGGTSGSDPYQRFDKKLVDKAITALRQAIEQAEQDHTYGYAKRLAEAIFKKHFASDEHYASGRIVWGVNDTVIGILTQIDNMVADMVRKPEQAKQAQPVATKLETQQFSCFHVSAEDFQRLKNLPVGTKLYTRPQALEPLTEEEMADYLGDRYHDMTENELEFFRLGEAAHGIKEKT